MLQRAAYRKRSYGARSYLKSREVIRTILAYFNEEVTTFDIVSLVQMSHNGCIGTVNRVPSIEKQLLAEDANYQDTSSL